MFFEKAQPVFKSARVI